MKQVSTDLRVPGGERGERRRGREERPERVAGVGEGRRLLKAEDIRRAPQQVVGSSVPAQPKKTPPVGVVFSLAMVCLRKQQSEPISISYAQNGFRGGLE